MDSINYNKCRTSSAEGTEAVLGEIVGKDKRKEEKHLPFVYKNKK
jgi:hypothetical protein